MNSKGSFMFLAGLALLSIVAVDQSKAQLQGLADFVNEMLSPEDLLDMVPPAIQDLLSQPIKDALQAVSVSDAKKEVKKVVKIIKQALKNASKALIQKIKDFMNAVGSRKKRQVQFSLDIQMSGSLSASVSSLLAMLPEVPAEVKAELKAVLDKIVAAAPKLVELAKKIMAEIVAKINAKLAEFKAKFNVADIAAIQAVIEKVLAIIKEKVPALIDLIIAKVKEIYEAVKAVVNTPEVKALMQKIADAAIAVCPQLKALLSLPKISSSLQISVSA